MPAACVYRNQQGAAADLKFSLAYLSGANLCFHAPRLDGVLSRRYSGGEFTLPRERT